MAAEQLPVLIYHLALHDEWQAAVDNGLPYRRSTLGRSLEEVGFLHCSVERQVQRIADLVYRGRGDVVLVTIEVAKVPAEVKLEDLDGGGERFPHIYGGLPLDAVISVEAVPLRLDGTLDLSPLLSPPRE